MSAFDGTIVHPQPNPTAKIMLVGEAPGFHEARLGQYFVGQAGELLTKLLTSSGIGRNSCYITNVIKEKPPDTSKKHNDVSMFIDLSKKVPIETDKYRNYVQILKREIEESDANIIVALGGVALYALTNLHPHKITKRRGSIYPCSLVPGRKVLVTIHPAACLYDKASGSDSGGMYIWRHFITYDLMRAKEESATRDLPIDTYQYHIEPTYDECVAFLYQDFKEVSFDIEVVNMEVHCISFASGNTAISIPFIKGGKEYFTVEQELHIWLLVEKILSNPAIVKIGQNLVFDTQFLFHKYGMVTANMEDTMIAMALLAPDFPKGLDFITSLYTKIPYYKDEGKKYFKQQDSDTNFWLYNAKDSRVCAEAFPELLKDLVGAGNLVAYQNQRNLIEVLVFMSEHGLLLDTVGLKKESEEIKKRIDELTDIFIKVAPGVSVRSPKQLATYFYGTLGYKASLNKAGNQTVDELSLKKLVQRGCQEANVLLEIRKLDKLRSTYLEVSYDDDGRLRCSYNPVGAADSGRLSSSKTIADTGTNLQTSPPVFRKFLLFDKNYAGYTIDLGQAENRIVAYIAPEPRMIEAFENGIDVHKLTASMMFNVPIEQVTSDPGSCPICQNPELCGHEGQRFWGKKSNHSFNYGLGPFTFAQRLEIPNAKGREIRDAYHAAYPGVKQYWAWVQERLRSTRTIENIFGRKRTFYDRWGETIFKEAYSFIPQSTVADIINRRGLLFIYGNKDLSEVCLLNQIHDSIVFQIPLVVSWTRHAEILLAIKQSLEVPLQWRNREFVIPADLTMGKTMKDKAKVKWDTNIRKLASQLEEVWNTI